MRALVKALFGDAHNLGAVLLAVLLSAALLDTEARTLAGVVTPILLLGAAVYLARR